MEAELLERARVYNSDHPKPYCLQRLRIFGSYLGTTIDPLGDVDVELLIGHRVTDPKGSCSRPQTTGVAAATAASTRD